MTNLQDTYWDAQDEAGVWHSLNTYSRNIETVGDGLDGVPPWRGEDRLFAYRPGRAPRSMVADSRTLTLGMWVTSSDEDDVPSTDPSKDFELNRQALKRLLWRPGGALVPLRKRWKNAAGTIVAATAMARLASTMDSVMLGYDAARMAVDVFLPDPFFYGDEVSTTVPVGTPTTITNDGDDVCTAVFLDLVGQLVNPVLTNSTPTPDVWVKLGAAVASGDTVTADVDAATVVRASDSANLIGAVSHSGARSWMGLLRGANSLVLTVDSGAGHVVVRHRPAYF